jgi:hypothetical protein
LVPSSATPPFAYRRDRDPAPSPDAAMSRFICSTISVAPDDPLNWESAPVDIGRGIADGADEALGVADLLRHLLISPCSD